jgi:hypothetical protein
MEAFEYLKDKASSVTHAAQADIDYLKRHKSDIIKVVGADVGMAVVGVAVGVALASVAIPVGIALIPVAGMVGIGAGTLGAVVGTALPMLPAACGIIGAGVGTFAMAHHLKNQPEPQAKAHVTPQAPHAVIAQTPQAPHAAIAQTPQAPHAVIAQTPQAPHAVIAQTPQAPHAVIAQTPQAPHVAAQKVVSPSIATQSVKADSDKFTIHKGDSLSSIAKELHLGNDGVKILSELNGIKDSNKIACGATLDLSGLQKWREKRAVTQEQPHTPTMKMG